MSDQDFITKRQQLTTPMLVLNALRRTPMHGYALWQAIQDESDGEVRIAEVAIYPILRDLERQKLIEGGWETPADGKPHKLYRITKTGQKKLETEGMQLKALWQKLAEMLGG